LSGGECQVSVEAVARIIASRRLVIDGKQWGVFVGGGEGLQEGDAHGLMDSPLSSPGGRQISMKPTTVLVHCAHSTQPYKSGDSLL
jgi:hypothetical protein